ncbi:hypothetical protein N7509_002078 [Penicillium cosmopolitanum]|uniref:Uncharacterized protein n=1 Tax=Penicillium cosmopolitanum TaxID=1131564 RepID=A0A9X0BD43_9EURO|nr:uncharacterized protein N7509_002078 [Penicillium cosmopolitanum]KAJ5408195.1 hypothetical protein N7509_002078 [Penicillium cosmopolitanum]
MIYRHLGRDQGSGSLQWTRRIELEGIFGWVPVPGPSPSVCLELDELFGEDAEIAKEIIRDWLAEAWYEYLRCFELTKRLEKREYGKKSFFYRIENGMLVDDPELELLPDEMVHASVESELLSVQFPAPEAEAGDV